MSEVGHSARVTIIVADYATVNETNNKFTIVGSGISLVGFDPKATTRTAPLSVVAIASFDPKFLGENPIVELTLETTDGTVVELPPGTDTPDEPPFPVHIKAGGEPLVSTLLSGYRVPADAIRPKVQMMMQFSSGLPLSFEHRYLWRVTVDGEKRDEWTESLFVLDLSKPHLGQ
jgi:hypothetical protein